MLVAMVRVAVLTLVPILSRAEADIAGECGKGLMCGALAGSTTTGWKSNAAVSMACSYALDMSGGDTESTGFKTGVELGSKNSDHSPFAEYMPCVHKKFEGMSNEDVSNQDVFMDTVYDCGYRAKDAEDDVYFFQNPDWWKEMAANTICEKGASVAAGYGRRFAGPALTKLMARVSRRVIAKLAARSATRVGGSLASRGVSKGFAALLKRLLKFDELHDQRNDTAGFLDHLNSTMRAKVAAEIAEATAIQRMKDEKTEKEKSKEQQFAAIAKAVAVGLVVALSALCWRWTCGKGNKELDELDQLDPYMPVKGVGQQPTPQQPYMPVKGVGQQVPMHYEGGYPQATFSNGPKHGVW